MSRCVIKGLQVEDVTLSLDLHLWVEGLVILYEKGPSGKTRVECLLPSFTVSIW